MAGNLDISFDSFWNIVDGKRRTSSRLNHGVNPATEEPLGEVPIPSEGDVNEAVTSAQRAFAEWSITPYTTRVQLLNQFADAFLQLADEFTALLKDETGRSSDVAQIEVHWSALWLRQPASLILPHQILEDEDKQVIIKYEPRGVVAAICPWNYPIMLAFGKIAPALAAGNCVIVKPAPTTPYTALKCVELAQSFFPPGVVQVLADDGTIGPILVDHPGIAHISFTGSTSTGKRIMQTAARTLKKVTLELGGNDAAIVLPDVNIEKAAPQIAMGAWWNSGQSCIAVKRVYIHESIYSRFVQAMVEFTKRNVTVGASGGGASVIPPIQNQMQYEKLRDLIAKCRKDGCTFALDQGQQAPPEDERGGRGFFLQPIIVDNPPPDSPLVTEEQFGPVLPCIPFSDIDEAINAANSTSCGLSVSVWGEDTGVLQRMEGKLDVGTVFINGPSRPDPRVPFSGHKESGIGVEYGLPGLIEYCQVKSIVRYKV
ncbi:hypothetical protein BDW75DRAFT_217764 [Aspergillus navahoensis]